MRKPKLSEASPVNETDIPMPNWGAILPERPQLLPTDIPRYDSVPAIGTAEEGGATFGAANTKNVAGAGVSSRVGPSAGQSLSPGQGK